MKPMTDRQEAALRFIDDYHSRNGFSPTIREIGGGLGIGSLRGVTVHLDALERKGKIILAPHTLRGIKIVKPVKDRLNPLRIKVVTDGTPRETKIVSLDTGEDLSGRTLSVRQEISSEHPESVTIISILGIPWETVERRS